MGVEFGYKKGGRKPSFPGGLKNGSRRCVDVAAVSVAVACCCRCASNNNGGKNKHTAERAATISTQ